MRERERASDDIQRESQRVGVSEGERERGREQAARGHSRRRRRQRRPPPQLWPAALISARAVARPRSAGRLELIGAARKA